MLIHTVNQGESVMSIGALYGVPPQIVAALNGIGIYTTLAVGQALVIRFPRQLYTVRMGDTLSSVAAGFGISVNDLYRANPNLEGRDLLSIGQTLAISYEDAPTYSFPVGGYLYPYVEQSTLGTVAPFMNVLIPFTYGIREDGSLYLLNDTRILEAARKYGADAWMHLSTYTEGERFDTALATAVLASTAVQDRLIENILAKLREKGYTGLDVDFEFLGKANALPYAAFLDRVTRRLNAEGYTVIAALAPKVRDDQAGLLYEGHDYEAVAAAVNYVLLMTYEWGYTYGPPQAISPLPQVRRVVEYALTKMPPQKIYLGISNYGYKWTLPYNPEEPVPAPSLSTAEATELAVTVGAVIQYDETAQAPYFTYRQNGKDVEVWYEDARSIQARLALIPEYGLHGALYWNLDRRNVQNLSLLSAINQSANTNG